MTRTRLHTLAGAAAAVALGCTSPESVRLIPSGQLYFPTGMFYAPSPGQGFLFVASSNFDRRYSTGRLTGIDVSTLGLPALGSPPGPVLESADLGTIDEKGLASLAGEMDGIQLPGGAWRILVPSRAEGSLLQVLDTTGEQITCTGEGATDDCAVGAVSLEANRLSATGLPRAPSPFSVGIFREDGDTFVTSLQLADSPAASGKNAQAFLVRLNALEPRVEDSNYIPLGAVPTDSVVVGRRYAVMSGGQSLALRLVDREKTDPNTGLPRLLSASAESNFNLLDTRGLALTADETEVFLVARRPDALLVYQARGMQTDLPVLALVHSELLPVGASQVRLIDKPSGGHLAFVTTLGTQSYDAVGPSQGALFVFDDTAGRVVAELDGIGFQPYGLAIQPVGAGARVYVGLFGEGRIAVVDVPDLDQPEGAHLVARLGTSHVCVVNPGALGCSETSP
ncbi:MAG TPA: hypothetical protein VND93_30965 [Myxococcales bacterium]|jgi:hypothetical protein|nr:hypothetical protein [Myxococcales bacterium]